MSQADLPCGWSSAAASDVCLKIQDGTHFSPQRQLAEGPYPYVTAKNVRPSGMDLSDLSYLAEDEHRPIYERTDVRQGDVLLVKDGVNTGDAAINTLPGEVSLLSSVCFLRPDGACLLPEFLRYYILSPQGKASIAGQMTGTAIKRIILRRIRSAELLIAPLDEQQRIVDALDSYLSRLDAAQQALERVQANLERYRASVLQAAVEGRLVPTEAQLAREEGRDYEPASVLLERILAERRARWEEAELATMRAKGKEPKNDKWKAKYKQPASPDESILPELPEGWCWASVEQLADDIPRSIQSGPFGSNLKHSEFEQSGVLVLGIDNVQAGFFSMGAEHRISARKYEELKKYSARPLDVLVTVMATVGRCCLVPENLEPAIITKHVYRITADRCLVAPEYLHLALWGGRSVREQMFGKVQGQTRPGLNGTILKSLAIPLPPRAEQPRILDAVAELSSLVPRSADQVAGASKRCGRLRQSVLAWAFEGKLVDQDPNDEPASALLERIRAEREAATPKKRTRKKKAPK